MSILFGKYNIMRGDGECASRASPSFSLDGLHGTQQYTSFVAFILSQKTARRLGTNLSDLPTDAMDCCNFTQLVFVRSDLR
jgi:hypothetical protein